MTVKSIFEWAFGFPPVEQRYVPRWFARCSINPAVLKADSEQMYMCYSLAVVVFWISMLFSLLNWLSQAFKFPFDFHFFVIDLTGSDYISKFLLTYTWYTATVLLIFVMPYYVIGLFWNYFTRPASFQQFWIDAGKFNQQKNLHGIKLWALLLFTFSMCILAMYIAFGLFALALKGYHLEDSYLYFLFCLVILPAAEALANFGAFFLFMRLLMQAYPPEKML
jgi:hypothetical protein